MSIGIIPLWICDRRSLFGWSSYLDWPLTSMILSAKSRSWLLPTTTVLLELLEGRCSNQRLIAKPPFHPDPLSSLGESVFSPLPLHEPPLLIPYIKERSGFSAQKGESLTPLDSLDVLSMSGPFINQWEPGQGLKRYGVHEGRPNKDFSREANIN